MTATHDSIDVPRVELRHWVLRCASWCCHYAKFVSIHLILCERSNCLHHTHRTRLYFHPNRVARQIRMDIEARSRTHDASGVMCSDLERLKTRGCKNAWVGPAKSD